MVWRRSIACVCAGCFAGFVAACTSAPAIEGGEGDLATGEPQPAQPGAGPAGGGGGTDGGRGTKPPEPEPKCPYTGPPLDVSNLAPCRDGGRCVQAALIPEKERSRLATCPGGYCVPQKIVESYGQGLPKTCTSINGNEGRCLSTVLPDIDAQKANLPQDACDPNERCAPCFDPLDGKETGACRFVSCDAPKTQAKIFGSCCAQDGKPAGRCVPKSTVPAANQDSLETKECAANAELCVPAETMAPGWVPAKCNASSIMGSYDGVCISKCVKRDFLAQLGTADGNCAAGHFCAPCKNPLTGGSTGAPGCAP